MWWLLAACTVAPEEVAPPAPTSIWDLPFDRRAASHGPLVPWPGTEGAPPRLPPGLDAGDAVVVGGPDGAARWIARPDGPDWLRLSSVAGAALPFGYVQRSSLPALSRGERISVPAQLVLAEQRVPIEVEVTGARARLVGLPEGLSSAVVPPWGFAVWGSTGAQELVLRLDGGTLLLAPRSPTIRDLERLRAGLDGGCFGRGRVERDVHVGAARWVAFWEEVERGTSALTLLDPDGGAHVLSREFAIGSDHVWSSQGLSLTLVGVGGAWAGVQSWRPLFVDPTGVAGCTLGGGASAAPCELGAIRVTEGECEPTATLPLAGPDFVPHRIVAVTLERHPLGLLVAAPGGEQGLLPRPWALHAQPLRSDGLHLVVDAEGRAGWLAVAGEPVVVSALGEAPPPPTPWLLEGGLDALVRGEVVDTAVDVVVRSADAQEVRASVAPGATVQIPGASERLTLQVGSGPRSAVVWSWSSDDLRSERATVGVEGGRVVAVVAR